VSWRLAITHRNGYRYSGEVTSSYNEVRMTPLTTPDQLVVESTVSITPTTRPLRYWDYWGTVVHAFDVHSPHTELSIVARSVVDTPDRPVSNPDLAWAVLRAASTADRFAELLFPTAFVPFDDELIAVGAELAERTTPRGAVNATSEWVRSVLEYQPGVTGVHTSALEAFRGGRGVCQDFAHLALAVLRSIGVPARYVSGYLYPDEEAPVGHTVVGQSHAWVEAWTGEWWAVDVTNGRAVGDQYVVVARGRDYADVAPLKGVYHGPPSESLGVRVELTRLA
jgi:transglutaminase-like putative cysteine protease